MSKRVKELQKQREWKSGHWVSRHPEWDAAGAAEDAWLARADLAVERERELVEALKAVLPLAWRDHRHSEEQLLLEKTERLVTKIDAQENGDG